MSVEPFVMCACGHRYGWHPIDTLCTGTNRSGVPCSCVQFVSTGRAQSPLDKPVMPHVRIECTDCSGSGECGACEGSGDCLQCEGEGEIAVEFDEIGKGDKVLGEVAA